MVSLLECRKEAIKAMDSNSCGSSLDQGLTGCSSFSVVRRSLCLHMKEGRNNLSITLPFLTPGSNLDGLDYDMFMVLNA